MTRANPEAERRSIYIIKARIKCEMHTDIEEITERAAQRYATTVYRSLQVATKGGKLR